MNYKESKKKLDAIRRKYGRIGEIIFKTAIQYVIEYGKISFLDEAWYNRTMRGIDAKHDNAEREGKFLFCTRDFEKAIIDCCVEICDVETYDLLIYIQREIWLGGGEVGEPDYQRAIDIIRNCLCYTNDVYGAYSSDCDETLRKFREMGLTDNEIVYFGWEYLFDVEEEDDYT